MCVIVSAFAERYYGYYGENDRDNWMSYDRSDLIPLTPSFNDSSLSPSSSGKGINLLVMHGTADTTIHPQNSMMLVRGVMQQQQQQQFVSNGFVSGVGRRNNNSTKPGGRATGGFPTRVGAIRISQLVMPDADLSNSRMAIDVKKGSPIDHHHQLLHSIFSHVTQYLATECFTSVGDGNRGRGFRTRNRRLRKRRRRRWRAGNRDQEKLEDQQQQQWGNEHQEHQRNDKSNSGTSNENSGGDRSPGGRYRRHNIDRNQKIPESSSKNDMVVVKTQVTDANGNNITKNSSWLNGYLGNVTILNNTKNKNNIASKRKKIDDDDEAEEDDEEDDESEESDDEYYDEEDNDEEDEDDEHDDNDDDE